MFDISNLSRSQKRARVPLSHKRHALAQVLLFAALSIIELTNFISDDGLWKWDRVGVNAQHFKFNMGGG